MNRPAWPNVNGSRLSTSIPTTRLDPTTITHAVVIPSPFLIGCPHARRSPDLCPHCRGPVRPSKETP